MQTAKKIDPSKVHPLNEWVLLKPHAHPDTTAGGIVIPKNVKDRTQLGTVLAVGRGKVLESGKRVEPDVKPGDVVLYIENTIAQRLTPADVDGDPVILPGGPGGEILAVIEQ